MKQFRKMIAVVLTVAMAASLGACGNGGAASSSAAASAANSAESGKMINIGVAQLLTHPAMDASLKGLRMALPLRALRKAKTLLMIFKTRRVSSRTASPSRILSRIKSPI